ncbi:MAG: YceD family protein [Cellvibrionaceae bacterium]
MSIGTPHQYLPQTVDARKFAHQGVDLSGELKLDRLLRFQNAIVSTNGPLYAQLQFDLDTSRHRVLTGVVKGDVSVICQRCMQPVTLSIDTELAIGIVSTEEAVKQLPKDLEPWLVDSEDSEADLYEVLEDELLLALPMVAYHEEQCVDKSLYSSGLDDLENQKTPDKSKVNPFSVLEGLKGLKKT